MRIQKSLPLCAVALSGSVNAAVSSDGYIWTIDSGTVKPASGQVSSISSNTAEHIIARRKGITHDRYMQVTDEDAISDINTYGGFQQPLFAGVEKNNAQIPSKVFVRISGYDGTVSEFNTLPDLWVEKASRDLYDMFETRFDLRQICEYHIVPRMKQDVSVKYTFPLEEGATCPPQKEIESYPHILAIMSTVPVASTASGRGVSTFHRTLSHLSATENLESTILILPQTSKLSKPTRKHRASELRKRVAYAEEEPLELPPFYPTLEITKSGGSTNSSNNNTYANLPRVIPQCFSSMSACTNTTNSCSGHGKCVKKSASCYTCSCGRTTVRTNKDGSKKTVQWGGNACQKKDVSTETLLFVAFTLFFGGVVAGAISLLYNMGSQDLPSVIGAGVVGPRAQK